MADFDYTRYAHSQGFYALRGKSQEFRKLAEDLFYIEGAIRYQCLLEVHLGSGKAEDSDLLKSYYAERQRIIDDLSKISKPRKDMPT